MSDSKADDEGNPTDHYFDVLEQQIIKRLHAEAESDEGRADLARSTGINDPQLIDELSRLGITADGLIAIRLFPLVLVAWAEDSADRGERTTVMAEALRLGIEEDSTAWVLLHSWLKKPPQGITVDAWKRYMQGTFGSMSAVARRKLIQFTEKEMTSVAKASGGHLGIGKVSKKERMMIQRLSSIMNELSDSTKN